MSNLKDFNNGKIAVLLTNQDELDLLHTYEERIGNFVSTNVKEFDEECPCFYMLGNELDASTNVLVAEQFVRSIEGATPFWKLRNELEEQMEILKYPQPGIDFDMDFCTP